MTQPVFAHGQLRLYLLSLLAERPMHGYELIQALSDRFGGIRPPTGVRCCGGAAGEVGVAVGTCVRSVVVEFRCARTLRLCVPIGNVRICPEWRGELAGGSHGVATLASAFATSARVTSPTFEPSATAEHGYTRCRATASRGTRAAARPRRPGAGVFAS